MTNKEFANEFFQVIQDGQFSDEALDFVDALSFKQTVLQRELSPKAISLLKSLQQLDVDYAVTIKDIIDSNPKLQGSRGWGGILNSLIKKGFLKKGESSNPYTNTYILTEEGKNLKFSSNDKEIDNEEEVY